MYHNWELLHEKGGETGLSREETSYHLGAGIEAFQRGQKTVYFHKDEQLSTSLISDENGELKNQYQYDAFGIGLEALEELPNRIRYTGQQYDQQTNQYYLRARYYNPMLGRFMQEDVYQGDGLNLYAYYHNNPVVYYDPSGYTEETQCGGLGKTASGQEEDGYRVSDARRRHILEGEDPVKDPGHGPNRGFTKDAFPDTWTDEQVISAIERVAGSTNSTWKQSTGPGCQTAPITIGGPDPAAPSKTSVGSNVRFKVEGQDHGLNITVIIEPGGEGIITGYSHV